MYIYMYIDVVCHTRADWTMFSCINILQYIAVFPTLKEVP